MTQCFENDSMRKNKSFIKNYQINNLKFISDL